MYFIGVLHLTVLLLDIDSIVIYLQTLVFNNLNFLVCQEWFTIIQRGTWKSKFWSFCLRRIKKSS
jgi:hypothetical protein